MATAICICAVCKSREMKRFKSDISPQTFTKYKLIQLFMCVLGSSTGCTGHALAAALLSRPGLRFFSLCRERDGGEQPLGKRGWLVMYGQVTLHSWACSVVLGETCSRSHVIHVWCQVKVIGQGFMSSVVSRQVNAQPTSASFSCILRENSNALSCLRCSLFKPSAGMSSWGPSKRYRRVLVPNFNVCPTINGTYTWTHTYDRSF